MPVGSFTSHLVKPEFPEDKCVTPNDNGNKPGGNSATDRVDKHLELEKKRITVGYAAYFFD